MECGSVDLAAVRRLPKPDLSARNAALLREQVRTGFGHTAALGCLNPDTGQLCWRLMTARMGGWGGRRAEPVQAPEPVFDAADYALPDVLVGTTKGRLYAALLAAADTSGVLPSNKELAAAIDLPKKVNHISRYLMELEEGGLINLHYSTPQSRTVEIVATGQVMRNAVAHRASGA